jgi:hypothetical protein
MVEPRRADQCRFRARKCRDAAQRAANYAYARQLLDIAQTWDGIAYDLDEIQRMRKMMAQEKAMWGRCDRAAGCSRRRG